MSTAISKPDKKFDNLTADFESNSSKSKVFSIDSIIDFKKVLDSDCIIPLNASEVPDMKEFDKDRVMQKIISRKHQEMATTQPLVSKSQKNLKTNDHMRWTTNF